MATTQWCKKCKKWDRYIRWAFGLNPPKCDCKEPDTLWTPEELEEHQKSLETKINRKPRKHEK